MSAAACYRFFDNQKAEVTAKLSVDFVCCLMGQFIGEKWLLETCSANMSIMVDLKSGDACSKINLKPIVVVQSSDGPIQSSWIRFRDI